ncbi:hypothetical protein JZ785_14020 [Alicyclobacillus curvatus]|jgi:hypothetical protein|nr:hypothetical protein JZ785_14020 [Alicyclobacillus curvatus]
MPQVGKFLFYLGLVVMVVDLVASIVNIVHLSSIHAIGLNGSSSVIVLFQSFYQGGVLIGLGKIIELLERKR